MKLKVIKDYEDRKSVTAIAPQSETIAMLFKKKNKAMNTLWNLKGKVGRVSGWKKINKKNLFAYMDNPWTQAVVW